MNGINLDIHFKAEYPLRNLPLYSGQSSSADLLEVTDAAGHAFEILAKPVHPTALLALAATIPPRSGVDAGYLSPLHL
jgi:hypothetical protein